MKFFQKRSVAAGILALVIVASCGLGYVKKPVITQPPSTAIVGSYTYAYDNAGVLSDKTMQEIDGLNASLFAQTGAQLVVVTVDTTEGEDLVQYAQNLGNQWGVGDAERNNGVVLVLALQNLYNGAPDGDYGIAVGDGLTSQQNALVSLLRTNLEADFVAKTYDAGVQKTITAFMDWFSQYYGVEIKAGYIPAVRDTFVSGDGYYTQASGYYAPSFGSLFGGLVSMLLVLCLIWMLADGLRYARYRRRYLRPGMGIPTVLYSPIFWGRPRRHRVHPPRTHHHDDHFPPFGGGGFGGGGSF
ncbi:MAG: TPM domain-containing protein, partial [Oscillospiraceae bacterium]